MVQLAVHGLLCVMPGKPLGCLVALFWGCQPFSVFLLSSGNCLLPHWTLSMRSWSQNHILCSCSCPLLWEWSSNAFAHVYPLKLKAMFILSMYRLNCTCSIAFLLNVLLCHFSGKHTYVYISICVWSLLCPGPCWWTTSSGGVPGNAVVLCLEMRHSCTLMLWDFMTT